MKIEIFLNQLADKKIFIIECSSNIIAQSYEDAIYASLCKKHDIIKKSFKITTSQDQISIIDQLNTNSIFEKVFFVVNAQDFDFSKIKTTNNFLVLRCKKFSASKISQRKDTLHIRLFKSYQILNDLILYFFKKRAIAPDRSVLNIIANYLFYQDFYIESEVEKLSLCFCGKNKINAEDLKDYFDYKRASLTEFYRFLLTSCQKDFFNNIESISNLNFAFVTSVGLNYFGNIFDFVLAQKPGYSKSDLLQIAKEKNFYDKKSLDFVFVSKLKSQALQNIILAFLQLESRCKQSCVPTKLLLNQALQEMFFDFKRSKLALEKSIH